MRESGDVCEGEGREVRGREGGRENADIEEEGEDRESLMIE